MLSWRNMFSCYVVWQNFLSGQAVSLFDIDFFVGKNLPVSHIHFVGLGMPEPRPGVIDVTLRKLPVAGAVKMPENDDLRLREVMFGKAVGSSATSKPAADNVQRALRWPKAMEESAQIPVAYAVFT